MQINADLVWTDHPAWCPVAAHYTRVIDTPDAVRWAAVATGTGLALTALDPAGDDTPPPPVDYYRMPTGEAAARLSHLTATLGSLGTVARVRTVNLWEAIGAGICQQAVSPWSTFKRLCRDLGEPVALSSSPAYRMWPAPDAITGESLLALSTLGLGEAAPTLWEAAQVYQRCGHTWGDIAPGALIAALQTIDGIDEGTARRIVCDHTGDYSFYPHDLNFRAWAHAAARGAALPIEPEPFSASWAMLAGGHASTMTALLVAWAQQQPEFSPRPGPSR